MKDISSRMFPTVVFFPCRVLSFPPLHTPCRTLLQRHSHNLDGSGASSNFREGLRGKGAQTTQTAEAQAAVGAASPLQTGLGSVIVKLLAKVRLSAVYYWIASTYQYWTSAKGKTVEI